MFPKIGFSFLTQTIAFILLLLGSACSGNNISGPLTLKALLSDAELSAGDTTTVTCFEMSSGSDTLADNVIVTSFPTEGVEIQGNVVTALHTGSYNLSCTYEDGTPSTPVLDSLIVKHGSITTTRLSFPTETVPAGQYILGDCEATDAHGNRVETDSALFSIVKTDDSLHVEGLHVHGTSAGNYSMTCDLSSHASEERVPANLEIVPGPAKELTLTTDPVSIVYGTDGPATVIVSVQDAFGNEISNPDIAPLTVTPDNNGITIQNGFTLSFQLDGVYTVSTHMKDNPEVEGSLQLIVDQNGPQLVLESPEQALRIHGDNQLTIKGSAQDDLALITEFTINGEPATLNEDGSFELSLTLEPGINAINVEAVNAHGLRSRETRWVSFAESYAPLTKGDFLDGIIQDGTIVKIGPDSIDDGEHIHDAPDDLATILEKALVDLSLENTMGGLTYEIFSTGGESSFGITYDFNVESITNGAPMVSLEPADGHLVMTLNYQDVQMEGLLDGDCMIAGFLNICPDASLASINIEEAVMTAWVVPTVDIETQMIDFELLMVNTEMGTLDIEWTGDLQDQLGDIESILNSEFSILFENFLSNEVLARMPEALEGVLNGWNIDRNVQIPGFMNIKNLEIGLKGTLSNIVMTHEGMSLHLNTEVRETKGQISDPIGSIGSLGCESAEVDTNAALRFGVADPVVNRFLHLVWASELLHLDAQVPHSAHTAGFCGFGLLSSALGVQPGSARVTVQPLLPPVANGCLRETATPEYRLQLGAFSVSYSYQKDGTNRTIDFLVGMDAPFTPSSSDKLALNLADPNSILIDVVASTGLTRTEELSIIEKLEVQGASYLIKGLNGCMGNVLAFAPLLDTAQMVPDDEDAKLTPEFEGFSHGQGALWFHGHLK